MDTFGPVTVSFRARLIVPFTERLYVGIMFITRTALVSVIATPETTGGSAASPGVRNRPNAAATTVAKKTILFAFMVASFFVTVHPIFLYACTDAIMRISHSLTQIRDTIPAIERR